MKSSLKPVTAETILAAHRKVCDLRVTSKLSNYLRGKKVIIVGADTSILGSNMGNEIEKHDVIVRINTAYNFVPFSVEWRKDIGRRTDIFYLAPSSMKWIAEKDMTQFYRRLLNSQCKFICFQNGHNGANYIQGDYVYPEARDTLKTALLSKSKPPAIKTQLSSSHDSCSSLCNLLSQIAGKTVLTRTGLLAIWDCLNHGAASVTVTGMSFYHGGGHMFRTIEGGDKLDPLKDHLNHKSFHDSNVEIALLKQMITTFGKDRIILKDKLAEVMEDQL